MKKIGFIGSGNMATAMIKGVVSSALTDSEFIYITDIDSNKTSELKKELGVSVCENNVDLVKHVDLIVLAIKPYHYQSVIEEISDYVLPHQIIVTIAAGVTNSKLYRMFDRVVKAARTMPNTPSLVGEGITAYSMGVQCNQQDEDFVKAFLGSFGKYVKIEENEFDIYTALCGSSPAFVYLFIEGLAESAKAVGFEPENLYDMIAQAVLGSAKMVLETKENPIDLKDKVCTPGGTTFEGVTVLENNKLREIVKKAALRTAEKSNELSQE